MIMLQMKIYICCKTVYQFKKKAFKNQKRITPFLVAPGGKRKSLKVIKVLLVKCASVTGITKAIVIKNVCSWDMETITNLGDQWIRVILNKIETEDGKLKIGAFWLFEIGGLFRAQSNI